MRSEGLSDPVQKFSIFNFVVKQCSRDLINLRWVFWRPLKLMWGLTSLGQQRLWDAEGHS